MGQQVPGGNDFAELIVSGSFTGVGVSGNGVNGFGRPAKSTIAPVFKGLFNVSLLGNFVATVAIEKSYDGGATWWPVSRNTKGDPGIYTAPMSLGIYEPEDIVQYRWNCTAYTSGTILYRISV